MKISHLSFGASSLGSVFRETNESESFKAVETAKQDAETATNNAKKYANEVVPAAQADADEVLQKAEAYKTARINAANGQASRFSQLYEEYSKYPAITKKISLGSYSR